MDANDKLNNLLQLLESGEIKSFADLQSRLQSPTEKTLLKCTSLLRNFDENIYTQVLESFPLENEQKISFDDFIRSPDLEAIPRTENVFRVKENVKQTYLQEWNRDFASSEPETGTDFLKNLISYYERDEPRYELDMLGVLILSDAERAKEKFLELFEKADKNFDLARCNDILATVGERQTLLNPETPGANELKSLCREKRQYLKARSLFSSDYYQTVFFYARQSVVKAFDNLLKDKETSASKWIFNLYAPGGMGKTMFVRWLIARHCVPEPRKIPVARLDFDFLHLPTVKDYPWLLILAIAEQLNQQIEGNPFDRHLSDYWHFVSLLRPPKEIPGDDSRANKEELIKKISPAEVEIIVNRFIDSLKELSTQKPFVVVLDTLERVVLHHQDSLLKALKFLEKIHGDYKQVRLLLSGRYNFLQGRLTEFNTRFQKKTVVHRLKPFSTTEARAYLTEKRNLHDEAIVKAIIKKCEEEEIDEGIKGKEKRKGSNPFKLSLIADFYQQEVVKTPKDILTLERTDVEYLINRIITHIKEPTVQWLLRYAVVPRARRFTRDIFEKVLAPHLVKELIERGLLDNPNKNYPEGLEKFENKESWKYLEDNEHHLLDHQKIWNDLHNYAGSQGWVSFEAGDDSTPQLHPDVIIPMRLLLEAQEPIFKELHEDCAAYFEKKAASEKDLKLWAQYVCEVIYHRFQKEGAKAVNVWREKLDSAKSQMHPSIRKIIAEEITRSDYVNDETKEPIQRPNGQYLVNHSDLYEAHLRAIEASIASIIALKTDELPALWTDVREHLDDLRQLDKKKSLLTEKYSAPFSEAVLRRLTTQLKKAKVNNQKVISLLNEAVQTTTSRQMLLSLEILLGDTLSALDEEEALKHYDRALEIRESVKSNEVKTAEIRLKIGLWYKNRRDYVRAERIYRNLLPVAKKEDNLPVLQKALRHLAEMNLEQGQYYECVKLFRKIRQIIKDSDTEEAFPDALFLIKLQARNLFEPLPALARLEPFLKTGKTLSSRAEVSEIYGDILGKLMQFEEALTEFEKAKELWTSASNPVGADRVRMLRVELQLFEIGDYKAVDSVLGKLERAETKADLELTCRIRLLRVLFEYRNDNRQTARSNWQKILKDEKIRQSPRCLIRALAMGLALNFGDDSTVKDFIAELKKIEPVSARLPLLDAFKYAGMPFNPSPADREKIKNLIDIESRGKDIIPHALFRVDLLRSCGKTRLAKKILDSAVNAAGKPKNLFAYREILLAKDRLGVRLSDYGVFDIIFEFGFSVDFAHYPHLCAAAYIEQAERSLRQGDIEDSEKTLWMAQDELKKAKAAANQWNAKLDELLGEVARRKGDADDARNYYNSALSVYKRLGNKSAVERLRGLLPQIDQSNVDDEKIFTVHLEVSGKTFSVESYSGEDLKNQEKFVAASGEHLLKTIMAEDRDSSSIYTFSKLYLDDPLKVENESGKFLFSNHITKQLKKSRKNKPDFRLNALAPSLAKMPWELARLDNRNTTSLFHHFYRSMLQGVGNIEQIKWLQIAVRQLIGMNLTVDGVFGIQTQEGLKILKRKLKLPENVSTDRLNTCIGERLVEGKSVRNTKALLIIPGQGERIGSQRGWVFSGSPLEWWYNDNYFTVETLWWSDIGYLKELMREFQPDVIHIQSSFRLMQTLGQIYLDFGFEPNYSAQQSFSSAGSEFIQPSVTFINDALALLPDSKIGPLVILDAISPSGITETIHQLLYRNMFAAELFQLGNASGIIAMGLCMNPELQGKITPILIPGLSNTDTLGSIVNSLRKLSNMESLEDKIATLGIALFTNEPSMTVLSDEKR